MGHADAGQVERHTQVQGQPGAARMVASGGVEQNHVCDRPQRANGGLTDRAETQGEQTGHVCGTGGASALWSGHHLTCAHRDCAGPCGVVRAAAPGQAVSEADLAGGH